MWVAGVDGCRIGWIAVLMRVDDPTIHRIMTAPTLAAIADAPERPAVIAVDMPIGLPEHTEGSGRARSSASISRIFGKMAKPCRDTFRDGSEVAAAMVQASA